VGALSVDFRRRWFFAIHAGLADDGALDRCRGWVVCDSLDAQDVALSAPSDKQERIRSHQKFEEGEEKTKICRLPHVHFSDVDEMR